MSALLAYARVGGFALCLLLPFFFLLICLSFLLFLSLMHADPVVAGYIIMPCYGISWFDIYIYIYIWGGGVWVQLLGGQGAYAHVILVLCECIWNAPVVLLVLPAFDDTGSLGSPPVQVVSSPV